MSYTITAPVQFEFATTGTALEGVLDFQAECGVMSQNTARNFSVSAGGDMLTRNPETVDNDLTCLPIGTAGEVLCVGAAVAQIDTFQYSSPDGIFPTEYGSNPEVFYIGFYVQSTGNLYIIWVDVTGSQVQPVVPGATAYERANISGAVDLAGVGTAITGAVSNLITNEGLGGDISWTAFGNAGFQITQSVAGIVDDIFVGGGTPAAGAEVATPTQGSSDFTKWGTFPGYYATDSVYVTLDSTQVIGLLPSFTVQFAAPGSAGTHDAGGHYNSGSFIFTAYGGTDAIYVISAWVRWSHTATNRAGTRTLRMVRNNIATLAEVTAQANSDIGVNLTQVIPSQAFQIASGDDVRIRVAQTSGEDVDLVDGAFSIIRYAYV